MKKYSLYILLLALPLAAVAQTGLRYNVTAKPDTNCVSFARPLSTQFTFRSSQPVVKPPVPQNFYTQSFGFFCKQELKMHKANIPLSFRLGSMDYCNMLEQKGCGR